MNTLFTIIANSNDAQQVSTSGVQFNSATFFACKGFAASLPSGNSTQVSLGLVSGQLPLIIPTGSYCDWSLQHKGKQDLSNFWVKGTAGDGVYIIYS